MPPCHYSETPMKKSATVDTLHMVSCGFGGMYARSEDRQRLQPTSQQDPLHPCAGCIPQVDSYLPCWYSILVHLTAQYKTAPSYFGIVPNDDSHHSPIRYLVRPSLTLQYPRMVASSITSFPCAPDSHQGQLVPSPVPTKDRAAACICPARSSRTTVLVRADPTRWPAPRSLPRIETP